jgi:uncharacterized spore protein YtfJ
MMQDTLDTAAMGGQMPFKEIFDAIVERAGAKIVYGEPVSAEGKTILPIAKIRFGFGGGTGRRRDNPQHGGGGGGGLVAQPVGVVEITQSQTRFIPIQSGWTFLAAIALGVGVGLLALPRRGD